LLKLRICRNLWPLRGAWKRLEGQASAQTSVYQSYYVNKTVKKRLGIYALQQRYSARYIAVTEDGKTKLILPLCRYWGRQDYCALGRFNGFQVYDLIYGKDMTKEEFLRCFRFVLEKLSPKSLVLSNVPCSSLLYQCVEEGLLEDCGYGCALKANDNVCICTGGDYDSWYAALSKHTRQNVRTAYNRMASDAVQMRYELYRGKKPDTETLDQIIELYCARHSARYGVQTSRAKKLYLRYLDFSTACLQNHKDNFCAVLYMNDRLAAFMAGMVEKEGSAVVIPRLSIEDDFGRYSPGVVLINETVKRMTTEQNIGNLDLSKGAEGYKLSMGGTLYHTYDITLTKQTD
jgi:hypothetical protein